MSAPYDLSPAEATFLAGLVSVPAAERAELASRLIASIPPAEWPRLFLAVIGMAETVIANIESMALDELMVAGICHPDRPQEHPNFASLLGACLGVKLAAAVDQTKTCDTCAYRLGSPANCSVVTVSDATWCENAGERPFMCHEHVDAVGEPTRKCRGWLQARERIA